MAGTRQKVATIAVTVAALVGAAGCSSDGNAGSEEAFCDQVTRVPSLAAALTNFADRDAAALEARLADALDAYEALADAAPSEVRGDTRTVVDLIDTVVEAVNDHPDDNEAAAAQLREAVADHPDAAEAGRRVTAYANETCGIDLDPVQTGATPSTTAAPADGD